MSIAKKISENTLPVTYPLTVKEEAERKIAEIKRKKELQLKRRKKSD